MVLACSVVEEGWSDSARLEEREPPLRRGGVICGLRRQGATGRDQCAAHDAA
jgi:hypothetical protein